MSMGYECCPNCGLTDFARLKYPEGEMGICAGCRLQWAIRDKAAKGFIPSYNDYYLSPDSLGEVSEYPPYIDFFDELKRQFGDKRLKILDVGCGSGAFVGLCHKMGHDVVGVEANDELKMYVPEDLSDKIFFGLAEDYECGDEKFDIITFWDSFEHIESSFDILTSLKGKLDEKGLVYLRVNNNNDIYNHVSLFFLKLFPALGKKIQKKCFTFPDHCWNFSKESMISMVKQRGWNVVKFEIGETPAKRLTESLFFRALIYLAYGVNTLIGGGKIGNYYIRPSEQR
jgi:2-polyprenyl-3-methyl-5-hydroxy-6-metoxy-1,4-benzoquinol methylase